MDLKNILFMRAPGKTMPGAALEEDLWAKKLFGSYEKSIDFSPVISVSDALAKPALELITKITAVQAGSGDPSPVNIRDLSGWSDGEITRAGKNLFQTTASSTEMAGVTYTVNEDGTVSVSGTASGFSSFNMGEADISNVGAKKITVSGIATATNIQWSNIRLFDSNNNVVYETLSLTSPSVTIDLANYPTAVKVVPIVKRQNNVATSGVIKPMVEIGDTAHDFMPYETPTHYPLSWLSEAGIIYGGLLNATAGALTATHAIKTYKGTSGEAWNYSERDGNRRVFIVLDDAKPSATDFLSNIASGGGDSSYPDPWKMRTNGNTRPSLIIGVDNKIESVNDWKALLANTNMIVIYPLAEPIEYTLTPTEITLLAGDNTIWSTTGDVSMKYLAKR